jgi:hypothetical protein
MSAARRTAILLALWSVPGVLAGFETFLYQLGEGRHPALWRALLQQCSVWKILRQDVTQRRSGVRFRSLPLS